MWYPLSIEFRRIPAVFKSKEQKKLESYLKAKKELESAKEANRNLKAELTHIYDNNKEAIDSMQTNKSDLIMSYYKKLEEYRTREKQIERLSVQVGDQHEGISYIIEDIKYANEPELQDATKEDEEAIFKNLSKPAREIE